MSFALLTACAASVAPVRAPTGRRGPPRSAPATACTTDVDFTLTCIFAGGAVQRWPFPRSHALRPRGGVWLVDETGALQRFDAQGRQTGAWSLGAWAVAQQGALLCVTTDDGALACGLDRFDPAACAMPEPPELFVVAEGAHGAVRVEDGAACAWDAVGERLCVAVRPVCERHCLRYPACGGELRCIDPCSDADALPLRAEPLHDARR